MSVCCIIPLLWLDIGRILRIFPIPLGAPLRVIKSNFVMGLPRDELSLTLCLAISVLPDCLQGLLPGPFLESYSVFSLFFVSVL